MPAAATTILQRLSNRIPKPHPLSSCLASLLCCANRQPQSGKQQSTLCRKKKMHTVTFSELIVRVDQSVDIGVAKDGIKVDILEELRGYGYNALGVENLVFNRDDSMKARFVLGGTLRELEWARMGHQRKCRIEIKWELWDRHHDQVVYSVSARAIQQGILADESIKGIRSAIKAALHSLMSRQLFVAILTKKAPPATPEAQQVSSTMKRCVSRTLAMPNDSADILNAVVLVLSGGSVGSGVVISPDGFVATAAHVVDDTVATVRFQDGKEHRAVLVRRDVKNDVALLHMKGGNFPCLETRDAPAIVGEKIYAIGSPASEALAFSFSTGIVSALRDWNGKRLLQTDASINPGNSGGPLIDEAGRVLAIISWKVLGAGVEGLAFGVPIDAGLSGLRISLAEMTSDTLNTVDNAVEVPLLVEAIEDTPDPYISLASEGTNTPRNTQGRWRWPVRIIGIVLIPFGAASILYSYTKVRAGSEDKDSGPDLLTYGEYRFFKGLNIAGWVIAPVGAVMLISSFMFKSRSKSQSTSRVVIDGALSPQGVFMKVEF